MHGLIRRIPGNEKDTHWHGAGLFSKRPDILPYGPTVFFPGRLGAKVQDRLALGWCLSRGRPKSIGRRSDEAQRKGKSEAERGGGGSGKKERGP